MLCPSSDVRTLLCTDRRKLRRNEPNHERTQLCLFPWIFITGCYICNCYRTDRLLYWTGYVLLCTYLRLHTDNTWNFNAGCIPDQYPCRICFWALQWIPGSLLVSTFIHHFNGKYEYRKRSCISLHKDTVSQPPQAADPDNGWFRNLVRYNGFPVGLVILLVVAVICAIILNKTRIGRYILCLGSNKEAVRLSGVDVKKWEMLAFIICGVLVGMGAIFYVSAYTTVQPGYGDQYNNEAIAGCVMGGTSMAGGLASISGTIIGVFIIALLQEGILALGFTKDYQLIITGVIVIVAVFSDVLARRRKN